MRIKGFKLTDEKDQTHGGCQWGPGVEHTAPGGELCTADVIHDYADPVLAVLMNPAHADFREPHLWEGEGELCIEDGTKRGHTWYRTIQRLPLPEQLWSSVSIRVIPRMPVYPGAAHSLHRQLKMLWIRPPSVTRKSSNYGIGPCVFLLLI